MTDHPMLKFTAQKGTVEWLGLGEPPVRPGGGYPRWQWWCCLRENVTQQSWVAVSGTSQTTVSRRLDLLPDHRLHLGRVHPDPNWHSAQHTLSISSQTSCTITHGYRPSQAEYRAAVRPTENMRHSARNSGMPRSCIFAQKMQ